MVRVAQRVLPATSRSAGRESLPSKSPRASFEQDRPQRPMDIRKLLHGTWSLNGVSQSSTGPAPARPDAAPSPRHSEEPRISAAASPFRPASSGPVREPLPQIRTRPRRTRDCAATAGYGCRVIRRQGNSQVRARRKWCSRLPPGSSSLPAPRSDSGPRAAMPAAHAAAGIAARNMR